MQNENEPGCGAFYHRGKQRFKNAARIAHTRGEVYIYENDQPRHKLVDLETDTSIEMSDDEKIDFVAARILKKYRKAFEELAK